MNPDKQPNQLPNELPNKNYIDSYNLSKIYKDSDNTIKNPKKLNSLLSNYLAQNSYKTI